MLAWFVKGRRLNWQLASGQMRKETKIQQVLAISRHLFWLCLQQPQELGIHPACTLGATGWHSLCWGALWDSLSCILASLMWSLMPLTPESMITLHLVSPIGDIWGRKQIKDGEGRADTVPGLLETIGAQFWLVSVSLALASTLY